MTARRGDRGDTTLYSGEVVRKSEPVFRVLGDLQELGAVIGVALYQMPLPQTTGAQVLRGQLLHIQQTLMALGAHIATPIESPHVPPKKRQRTQFGQEHYLGLEECIAEFRAELPTLRNFILIGGPGAYLHWANTICRRAERSLWKLRDETGVNWCDDAVYPFVNRLSLYLFNAGRYANYLAQVREHPWTPAAAAAAAVVDDVPAPVVADNSAVPQ